VQILFLIGLYFLKCTKFDQLILRKIIKIAATRCQILTLKCTKIDFGWGSAPDPAAGAYSTPPDPLARFKGPTSKGRERERKRGWEWESRKGERRKKREGNGKGQEGRERKNGRKVRGGNWEGRGAPPLLILQFNHWLRVQCNASFVPPCVHRPVRLVVHCEWSPCFR